MCPSLWCVLLLSVLCLGIASARPQEAASDPVNKLPVTIYYDTGCPGCREFLTMSLGPSMRLKNRLPYTDLKLVPAGLATFNVSEDGEFQVTCPQGKKECKLNAMHACLYETTPIGKTLDIIVCMESGTRFTECALSNDLDLDVIPLSLCVFGRSDADILWKYGEEAEAAQIEYVPTVAFDGQIEQDEDVLNDFDWYFCQAYENKFGEELDDCEPEISMERLTKITPFKKVLGTKHA